MTKDQDEVKAHRDEARRQRLAERARQLIEEARAARQRPDEAGGDMKRTA